MDNTNNKSVEKSTKRRVLSLSDSKGLFFPQTHINAVFDAHGRSLSEILENIQAGEENLSDIRQAISELQDKAFPLKMSLTSEKSTYEYDGSEKKTYLNYSIEHRNDLLTVNDVSKVEIIKSSDGLSNFIPNNESEKISFIIEKPINFTGLKNYNVEVKITLKNEKTTSSKIDFNLLSRSWMGWSPYHESIDWITKETLNDFVNNGDMKNYLQTNLSDTYYWNNVKKGYSFWIIVPNDKEFTGFSTITVNGFPLVMEERSTVYIGDVNYRCIVNSSGGVSQENTNWSMTLS